MRLQFEFANLIDRPGGEHVKGCRRRVYKRRLGAVKGNKLETIVPKPGRTKLENAHFHPRPPACLAENSETLTHN